MQVIVDNLLTNYAEVGKGSSVILFLHGWADSSKTFEGLASQITENNAEYKAVMLDLPGFGATQSSGNDWDLQDFADFVRKFLDKLSLRPRTIVGHSNGGAIAIYGLANNVFESDNLILIASAGIRSKTAKKEILRYASKPAKLGLKLTPKQTQKRLKRKLYSSIGSDYLVAEHMQETFK